MNLLWEGALIGFLIAMPVGPIGMMCIRNSLSLGMRYGFMTGMGAAFADAIYGGIAGCGVATLTTFLISYKLLLQIVGGLFLCYLGIKSLRSKEAALHQNTQNSSLLRVFTATLFLTLTNPMTIMSFAGVYTGLGIGFGNGGLVDTLMLTFGVLLGSATWWLMLSSAASLFKNRFDPKRSHWLNRVSGTIFVGFGLTALFI